MRSFLNGYSLQDEFEGLMMCFQRAPSVGTEVVTCLSGAEVSEEGTKILLR